MVTMLTTNRPYGVRDEKGRELGLLVTTWEEGGQYMLRTWSCRDGRAFGPVQPTHRFATAAERDADAFHRFAASRRRQLARFTAADTRATQLGMQLDNRAED
jgi:hypothetical protein